MILFEKNKTTAKNTTTLNMSFRIVWRFSYYCKENNKNEHYSKYSFLLFMSDSFAIENSTRVHKNLKFVSANQSTDSTGGSIVSEYRLRKCS